MLFNLPSSRRPTRVFVEILWFSPCLTMKGMRHFKSRSFCLIVQRLHNDENLIFHSISNAVPLRACGCPFSPAGLWKTLTKRNLKRKEVAGSRDDNQAFRTAAIIVSRRAWKAASNRNTSLFPSNGPSLAAACDVCHPLLAPAVLFDIACRSTRVKRDFPTSGVKAPILRAQDGDG